VSSIGERVNSYKVLMGKPEGNGRFGDLERNWENVDRNHLAHDRDW
jgi:hypothetical protein